LPRLEQKQATDALSSRANHCASQMLNDSPFRAKYLGPSPSSFHRIP
jgi:hypothetical protein